ncbi:MAG: MFS transporter [Pseudomonadota bacterium]
MSDAHAGHLQEAKRTALIFASAQAVIGSAAPIMMAMGGLAGDYLLGADKTLATAPVTGFTVGVALGAMPAAMFMRLVGSKNGFMTGSLVTAFGGALAGLAIMRGDFWLLVTALLVVGLGGAFVQQFRFAAADASPADFKPKAIAWVLGGGVIAAILGPQLVILTRDMMAPVEFAGAFFAVSFLGFLGMGVLSLLRSDRSLQQSGETAASHSDARPLSVIITQPRFLIAFACGVTSYALMSFMMTGAPLAMVGCGLSIDQATLGISWHVMAMFAPSFITGRLITIFGKEAIVGAGLVILLTCGLVALTGVELWQFWLALILLGVGWNFGFIGSTAMITDTYRRSEKNKVQGVHDFALFSTVAFASLMSGATLNAFGETAQAGWVALNLILIPIAAACLLLLVIHTLATRRSVQTA